MERNIRILKWTSGLIGFLPANALWIIYFAHVSGSLAGGSLVFAVGMFVAAFFDLPCGVLSDRWGRKPVAILAAISFLLCLVAYAVAQNWWELLIAAVFDGLGIATISGNNTAMLHESLTALGREEEFGTHYGQLQAWDHGASFIAAILGSAVAVVSLRWTVALGIVPLIPCVAIAFWLKEPERHIDHAEPLAGHVRQAFKLIAGNRKLVFIAVGAMVTGGVGNAMFQLRPSWIGQLWPVWAVGAVRATSSALGFVGSWWAGAIIKRFGAYKSITVVQVASSGLNIFALCIRMFFSPALLTTGSFTYGLGATAQNVILQAEFNDEQRATLSSFVSVGGRTLYGLSALAIGALASQLTFALVAGELIVIMAVGMFVAARHSRVAKQLGDPSIVVFG